MRKAVILSIVLHVALVGFLTVRFPQKLRVTHAGGFMVDLANPSGPPAEAPPLGKLDALKCRSRQNLCRRHRL